jgi:hypothetical protein
MLPETAPTVDESSYRIWMPNAGKAGVVAHAFLTGKPCTRIDIRLAPERMATVARAVAWTELQCPSPIPIPRKMLALLMNDAKRRALCDR